MIEEATVDAYGDEVPFETNMPGVRDTVTGIDLRDGDQLLHLPAQSPSPGATPDGTAPSVAKTRGREVDSRVVVRFRPWVRISSPLEMSRAAAAAARSRQPWPGAAAGAVAILGR